MARLLDEERRQGRAAFADAVQAVQGWLTLPQIKCPEIAALQFDARALRSIADACIQQTEPGRRLPVFADMLDRGAPRLLSTADIDFETTLQHRYQASHSELNAAACHTEPEVALAKILDEHLGIEAWARNFRLGWEVPWFDHDLGDWRRTEPDFVARAKRKEGERALHLVIEFKGLKAGEWSEEGKRLWLGRWAEAVTGWHPENEDFGEWRLVWVEDLAMAEQQIDKALMLGGAK